ncbi:GRAM domain-containing protein 1B-like isoform X2 [Acanthaster planci]|uniref:GRAM domain-containing protein 1B-like isoform X2 n=1 Tax=Acanthaster planci TaxID=133434 RepID=A0A8B7Z521_ACAPL|nr:GRAM domain-containing protein 1B-like isoform X2 [Acanthaster planci]
MAQKQHRSLLNAGTFLDFLSPTSGNSRDRRSSQPATTLDSPANQSDLSPDSASNLSGTLTTHSPNGVEHGEDAVLALTSGEIPGPSTSTTNPPPPRASQSSSTCTTETQAAGQREALSPATGNKGEGDSPTSGSVSTGGRSEQQSTSGTTGSGNRNCASSGPVVVIVGQDSKESESQEESLDALVVEGEEGGAMTTVTMPPVKQTSEGMLRDKDTSSRQAKERQSSELTSREPLSSESEVDSGNNATAAPNQPSPIHVSRSCPSELPLLDQAQQQQQHLGFETSGSSVGSPTEKLSPTGKEDKSPKPVKRNSSKKSPWYTVLSASYKSKSEEFRKYFKNIHNSEKLIADYSCALQKDILVQGRMYVTENWLCFYANIFKWETLLTIRLKDITAITKERTMRLIPNAVQIATESEKHFFTSFISRDRTFLLLFKVWQNALLDQKMPPSEYWMRVHSNYGTNLGLAADELPEDYVCPDFSPDDTEIGEMGEFDESKSQGTEGMEEEDDDDDEEEEVDNEELETLEGSEVEGQRLTISGDTGGTPDVPASKALDEEGEVQSLEPNPLHPEAKEYMNSYFNVTVDKFFAALYKKEHPFYRNFLLHRKHTDIDIGEWEQSEERDVRSVSYTFHLNNTVGPKSCGVEERQIFFKNWSRPGHSYVINLEVWQKGVPYADYFYTEARMVITRVSSSSCHVRVTAHLVYKKSPWGPIRSFIERNSESGIKVKHVELDTYVRQHLESRKPAKDATKKARKRKLAGMAIKEDKEELARPIRRMDSMPVINTKSTLLAKYLPPWLRTDSRNIMLLICIFLTLLSIVNVSLFLQLQTLEQLAVRTDHEWSAGSFADRFKDVPQTKEEWSVLLQKQLYYHELEMERWREVLGLCIELMKKMELTLQELHTGIKPTRIPDLDKVLQHMKEGAHDPEE